MNRPTGDCGRYVLLYPPDIGLASDHSAKPCPPPYPPTQGCGKELSKGELIGLLEIPLPCAKGCCWLWEGHEQVEPKKDVLEDQMYFWGLTQMS